MHVPAASGKSPSNSQTKLLQHWNPAMPPQISPSNEQLCIVVEFVSLQIDVLSALMHLWIVSLFRKNSSMIRVSSHVSFIVLRISHSPFVSWAMVSAVLNRITIKVMKISFFMI